MLQSVKAMKGTFLAQARHIVSASSHCLAELYSRQQTACTGTHCKPAGLMLARMETPKGVKSVCPKQSRAKYYHQRTDHYLLTYRLAMVALCPHLAAVAHGQAMGAFAPLNGLCSAPSVQRFDMTYCMAFQRLQANCVTMQPVFLCTAAAAADRWSASIDPATMMRRQQFVQIIQ